MTPAQRPPALLTGWACASPFPEDHHLGMSASSSTWGLAFPAECVTFAILGAALRLYCSCQNWRDVDLLESKRNTGSSARLHD